MGVGADFTVFSEISIPFDIGSSFEDCSFFEVYISLNSHSWFYNCSFIYYFRVISDDRIIGFQEIPRVSDRDPSTRRFYDGVLFFPYVLMDEISNLDFSTWGKGDFFEIIEYAVIEAMISDVCKVSDSSICWFFDDSCGFSCGILREYSEILWMIDGFAEGSISSMIRELSYIFCIIDVISREYDKIA